MASLSPTTWNRLGLGVAATYTALGAAALVSPVAIASRAGFPDLVEKAKNDVAGVMASIGARDISFGIAITALSVTGRYREMGTVIMSTLFFGFADLFMLCRDGKTSE